MALPTLTADWWQSSAAAVGAVEAEIDSWCDPGFRQGTRTTPGRCPAKVDSPPTLVLVSHTVNRVDAGWTETWSRCTMVGKSRRRHLLLL
eukprot:677263-Pyramimonas_sp.AAC.1